MIYCRAQNIIRMTVSETPFTVTHRTEPVASAASFACRNVRLFNVEPVSFSLAAGKTLCITGPSGCGKSLLLRALADLLPHQGEVYLHGKSAQTFKPEAWRHAVGFLAAESQWWFDSVAAHFPVQTHPQASEMIARLGLDANALHWQVRRCSTGERQRLALVRLLVRKPQVLLLDEPTANVDKQAMQLIEKLVKQYQAQNHVPVIWVSHDDEQVRRIADAVYDCKTSQVSAA